MLWRPEGWNNPYKTLPRHWFGSDNEASTSYYAKQEGYEEGADAMLEALRKEGRKQGMKLSVPAGIKLMANGKIYTLYKTEGQSSEVDIIIIPDEEGK